MKYLFFSILIFQSNIISGQTTINADLFTPIRSGPLNGISLTIDQIIKDRIMISLNYRNTTASERCRFQNSIDCIGNSEELLILNVGREESIYFALDYLVIRKEMHQLGLGLGFFKARIDNYTDDFYEQYVPIEDFPTNEDVSKMRLDIDYSYHFKNNISIGLKFGQGLLSNIFNNVAYLQLGYTLN